MSSYTICKYCHQYEHACVCVAAKKIHKLTNKLTTTLAERDAAWEQQREVQALWDLLPNIENKYPERLPFHLRELVAALKSQIAEVVAAWNGGAGFTLVQVCEKLASEQGGQG